MFLWSILTAWMMAWPDDASRWFVRSQRILNTLEIAEQLFYIGDMIPKTLISRFPAMCFCLCLENEEKRINILSGKDLQRSSLGISLEEKGEKVSQTRGALVQGVYADTSRQFEFNLVLNARSKHIRY